MWCVCESGCSVHQVAAEISSSPSGTATEKETLKGILRLSHIIKHNLKTQVSHDPILILDCAVLTEEDRSAHLRVDRTPTHMDQYPLCDTHRPLEYLRRYGGFSTTTRSLCSSNQQHTQTQEEQPGVHRPL